MDSIKNYRLNCTLINTYFSYSRDACVDSINRLKSISFKLVLAVKSSSNELSGAKFSTEDFPRNG